MRRLGVAVFALAVTFACTKKPREPGGTVPETPRADAAATAVVPAPVVDAAVVTKVALHPPDSHRTAGSACKIEKGSFNKGWEGCKSDKECQKEAQPGQLNGRCMIYSSSRGPNRSMNVCEFDTCMQDSDCQAGPCICNVRGNFCGGGNCKVDADCGAGGFCSQSGDDQGHASCGTTAGWFCRTAKDDCVEHSDCKPGSGYDAADKRGERCVFSKSAGKWTCVANLPCPVG